jgi:hypothetical protein
MQLQILHKGFFALMLITLLMICAASAQTKRPSNKRAQTVPPAPNRAKDYLPAQLAKCTLTLAQAPEIRGIRLGMSLEQALSVFPSLKRPPEVIVLPDGGSITRDFLEPDEVGVIRVRINTLDPKYSREATKLEGIGNFNFDFTDGRISYISVIYDTQAKWSTPDEFAQKVSESLRIPSAWKKPIEYNRESERDMECDGFVITVRANRYTAIFMRDLRAEQVVKNRKIELEKAKEKKDREGWKP